MHATAWLSFVIKKAQQYAHERHVTQGACVLAQAFALASSA